jgi:hypothetical protein
MTATPHHSFIQTKTLMSFTGTCECGRWNEVALGRDAAAQEHLRLRFKIHKSQAQADEKADARLKEAA